MHSITRMVISITALSLKLCNSLLLRAFPATYISNLLNKFKIPFTCYQSFPRLRHDKPCDRDFVVNQSFQGLIHDKPFNG